MFQVLQAVPLIHTWGQNLLYHPHVHCVATGGGLSLDGTRWVACLPGFFLPVRVLSHLFRRLFPEALEAAFSVGKLRFCGALTALRESFLPLLTELAQRDWVVYAKPLLADRNRSSISSAAIATA